MKTKNKAFLIAVSAMLIVIATTFGTLAYLTSEITVTHTFTVGDVKVSVNVNNWSTLMVDGNTVQTGEVKKLMPNHEYYVPVSVTIDEESEDAWVFLHVINPFEDTVEASTEDVILAGTEYEGDYVTVAEQIVGYDWQPLSVGGALVDDVYVYSADGDYIVHGGATLPVYDYFKVNCEALGGTVAEAIAELEAEMTTVEGDAETEAVTIPEEQQVLYLGEYEGKSITVIVYVVQADGLDNIESAWSVFAGQYEKNLKNPQYYPNTDNDSEG